MQQQMTLPMGAIIRSPQADGYVVEGILGKGGSSAVYKVRDWRTQQLYALKSLVNPSSQDRHSLTFEAELLMRLNHPSLPHVYQVFENTRHNRIYLLMDYIEGKDLERLRMMQPDLCFSLLFVLTLLAPIVDAIAYLHTRMPPVVHRDIKPGNIIVPERSADALLVDFGLAKEYIVDKTTNLFRFGTPGYAAPEQYGQGTGPRTDIYGLAATTYTLLTGIVPIDALTRSVNRFGSDPLMRADQVCSAIPPSVGKVIARGMSLHSEDRYATIEEFWNALSAASKQTEAAEEILPLVVTGPTSVEKMHLTLERQAHREQDHSSDQEHSPEKGRSPGSWKLLLFALLSIVVLGSAAGGFLLFTLWSRHPTPAPVVRRAIQKPAPTSTSAACAAPGTPVPDSLYPQLAPCYAGTINDVGVAGRKTALYLTGVNQQQGNISGRFQGLGVTGTFTGTISQSGSVQFVVKLTGRADTIRFEGNSKYGGDITGYFTAYDRDGQPSLDEYGDWYAQPLP